MNPFGSFMCVPALPQQISSPLIINSALTYPMQVEGLVARRLVSRQVEKVVDVELQLLLN